MSQREKAVLVRGLTKQYGRSRKAKLVLDGLDMVVEKGTIYGLLGASGCGKTTLLTCIVGRRSFTSGDVWVLGGKPGNRESGVPGPLLGYMPQETALVRQFSIRDALNHFGWIYGMKTEEIDKRLEFLTDLLELPPADAKIKNLSGGQQRRVSLAVALVQDPELIVLDEPTVGLDPVLRQRIWDFLVESATKYNKTIIITTHYIEEARQAHRVGLMRNGKLLAEDTPDRIIQKFKCSNLEEAFLRLSANQERSSSIEGDSTQESLELNLEDSNNLRLNVMEVNQNEIKDGGQNAQENTSDEADHIMAKSFDVQDFLKENRGKMGKRSFRTMACHHAKALMSKNFFRITRHPGAVIFIFFFPMLELCSFYLAVGGTPHGLKIGIVNEEIGNFTNCDDYKSYMGNHYGGQIVVKEDSTRHCKMDGLSCKFLEKLNDEEFIKVPYLTTESALRDAKKGKLIGVLYFSSNFSKEFEERVAAPVAVSDEAIERSQVSVWVDLSIHQNALLFEKRLFHVLRDYINQTFTECELPPATALLPMRFHEPIYGYKEENFNQFLTPGLVVTMIFFLSVSVTATIIVVERLDGIWDRTLLAGVSSTEILLSHIVTEAGVVSLQVVEVLIFVFLIFGIPCIGSYIDIIILLFLQGFCGMCGGFLVSVSCDSVTSSNFVSMGSFYPVLILSGFIWPIEGMPRFLRTISMGLPTTQATLSMRYIMEKGWKLSSVYEGYVITILWILIFSGLSMLIIRSKK